jgi:hypothetical protein
MSFNPGLLPGLLDAFYPVVTPAHFALAKAEHPAWFDDGVIFGSKGDKLRFPDGRQYDCIQNAGLSVDKRRWQCVLIDPTAVSSDDPFARDEGSLTTIDEDVWTPAHDTTFTGLVGQFVSDTRGMDDALARAQRPVITLVGVDPDAILSPHEADVIASQRADRARLKDLYALDEVAAGDAADLGTDGAARDVHDVQAAHHALSPRIDAGAREIPVEPLNVPGDVPVDREPPKPGGKNEIINLGTTETFVFEPGGNPVQIIRARWMWGKTHGPYTTDIPRDAFSAAELRRRQDR